MRGAGDQHLGRLPGRRRSPRSTRSGRRRGRAPRPDRDGHLADPGAAAPRAARRVPRGEVAPVRAGRPRRRPRRRLLAFGEDVAIRYDFDEGRRHPRARRRLPRRPAPATCATPASFAAPARARRRGDEPALRRRAVRRRSPARWPTTACALPAHRVVAWSQAVAQKLGVQLAPRVGRGGPSGASSSGSTRWCATSRRTRGRASSWRATPQPPIVHALAHAINEALGNVGKTVVVHRPRSRPSRSTRWRRSATLVRDMEAGEVDVLLILGGNPALHRARPTSRSPRPCPRSAQRPTWASTTTRPRRSATGTPRGARAGGLGRRPGLRRDGDDPAAPDRPALRRPVGVRGRRRPAPAPHPLGLRHRPRDLEGREEGPQGRDFETFWRTVGARRRGRRTPSCRPRT